jgi:phosphate starvation-inducible PhoH-like protein
MKNSAVKQEELYEYHPLTENQKKTYDAWDDGDNLALIGSAGTGKTFLAMYLALECITDKDNQYEKITLFRSVVPTRDMGYLPGTVGEKMEVFETPYKNIISEILGGDQPYKRLLHTHQFEFMTTSFIRGLTVDNSIIIVDEMQNLNFHELDSVMTRVGNNCRIIFCGDYHQSDFREGHEREGIMKFMRIVEQMKNFNVIQFGWEDIVRSDFVRDYIMTKEWLGIR